MEGQRGKFMGDRHTESSRGTWRGRGQLGVRSYSGGRQSSIGSSNAPGARFDLCHRWNSKDPENTRKMLVLVLFQWVRQIVTQQLGESIMRRTNSKARGIKGHGPTLTNLRCT